MPQIVWNAASHLADEWRHFDIHFRNSHTTHLSRSYPIPLDNKVRSGRLWNIPKYPEMKKRWKGVGRRVKSSKEGPPDLVLVHIGHLKLRLWTTNSSLFPKLFPRIQTPQVVCWSIRVILEAWSKDGSNISNFSEGFHKFGVISFFWWSCRSCRLCHSTCFRLVDESLCSLVEDRAKI